MENKNQKNGETLLKELNQLHKEGRIPTVERKIIPQKRWQKKAYPSGVHFNAPKNPEEMGRYNDPTGRTSICYTADYVVTAIAESYGRQYHKEEFFIDSNDLSIAQLCSLETTRDTKTIDMKLLVGVLHIPADKIMGDDQSITREVTDWAANMPDTPYDGITYRSRHYDMGTCTAFWIRPGQDSPLKTVDMTSVDKYIDTDKANFPPGWNEIDIDGTEIVTETLRFTVVSNNKMPKLVI
ncbi:RES family NAD+ phosphorylase [Photorhabdus khanii]|uniref:RES domain-containing protein n=1 Tax=Photorhabdus khanii subsp. guanajuatensis TaxID=2100166 RepID=A0A4V2X4F2_9GAMM|nr:RES family NAD+ phosphorylase [Photorhabdus khanii]TDB44045.1 RES domain-containing protein [Photorhabdus khanii subsp. guanajuatensis]